MPFTFMVLARDFTVSILFTTFNAS